MTDLKISIANRPKLYSDGEAIFTFNASEITKQSEYLLGAQFVCSRSLFGEVYRSLMPEYFYSMPKMSGVMIGLFIPSEKILPMMTFPGDIDLLIIPYESDQLVLSKSLAVELKVVRASFEKQGKSPNEYGFSQAIGLLEKGFPYVAVGHLIVSDTSPEESWREVETYKVIDEASGLLGNRLSRKFDMLPSDLIRRGFGRLRANRQQQSIGIFSAYLSTLDSGWYPDGEHATYNSSTSVDTLFAIGDFYNQHFSHFMDTPRYPR